MDRKPGYYSTTNPPTTGVWVWWWPQTGAPIPMAFTWNEVVSLKSKGGDDDDYYHTTTPTTGIGMDAMMVMMMMMMVVDIGDDG